MKTIKHSQSLIGLFALLISTSAVAQSSSVSVEETDSGFTHFGPPEYWKRSTVGNNGGAYYTWTSGNRGKTNWGIWNAKLPRPGKYLVQAYIPSQNATTTRAHYQIKTSDHNYDATINQSAYFNRFVDLGTYNFPDPGVAQVTLDDVTGEAWGAKKIGFDTIRFTYVGDGGGTTPPPPPPPLGNRPSLVLWKPNMISGDTFEIAFAFYSKKPNTAVCTYEMNFPGRIPVKVTANSFSTAKDQQGKTYYYKFFQIKLSALNPALPRFTTNVQVPLTGYVVDENGKSNVISGKYEFLLPIILIRGILPPSNLEDNSKVVAGEPSTFGNFITRIEELRRASSRAQGLIGSTGYNLFESGNEYATLSSMRYMVNSQSIEDAAETNLKVYVLAAKTHTYANKVILVGHSKGGLVARWYTQVAPRAGDVAEVITANTPHSGSFLAWPGNYVVGIEQIISAHREYFFGDLLPTYPFARDFPGQDFVVPDSAHNYWLSRLNSSAYAKDVRMLLLYSTAKQPNTFAIRSSGLWIKELGDGYVPVWSQEGCTCTINKTTLDVQLVKIPSLWANPLCHAQMVGTNGHTDVLNRNDYIDLIFDEVYNKWFP